VSQPVKLSDALVLDARLAAQVMQRSIAGQVEFWARLGRSMESLLQGGQAASLARARGWRPVSESLAMVDSDEGRRRVASALASGPFPRYEAGDAKGTLVRIDADGVRTVGRFVQRRFVPIKERRTRR
jgi:hypothetical protein